MCGGDDVAVGQALQGEPRVDDEGVAVRRNGVPASVGSLCLQAAAIVLVEQREQSAVDVRLAAPGVRELPP